MLCYLLAQYIYSVCDRDVAVKICILMLRSETILQMKTLHFM